MLALLMGIGLFLLGLVFWLIGGGFFPPVAIVGGIVLFCVAVEINTVRADMVRMVKVLQAPKEVVDDSKPVVP